MVWARLRSRSVREKKNDSVIQQDLGGRPLIVKLDVASRRFMTNSLPDRRCDHFSSAGAMTRGWGAAYKHAEMIDFGTYAGLRGRWLHPLFQAVLGAGSKLIGAGFNDMKKLMAAISGIGVFAASAAQASGLTPGRIGMQPANSALAEEVHTFHNSY